MSQTSPEMPENIDEASEILRGEDFFIPPSNLPDDSEELKQHVTELYINLAKGYVMMEYSRKKIEERTEETKRKAEELKKSNKELRENIKDM